MKMTVVNKRIKVGDIEISGVGSSSIVLIGDSEVITSSSYFDTPADSLVFSRQIPLRPPVKEALTGGGTDDQGGLQN
jgi:spore germination protein PD